MLYREPAGLFSSRIPGLIIDWAADRFAGIDQIDGVGDFSSIFAEQGQQKDNCPYDDFYIADKPSQLGNINFLVIFCMRWCR